MNRVELKNRFVIVADIVGFKAFMEKEESTVINAIVGNFFDFIKDNNIKNNQIEKYGIINDTIYFVFKDNASLESVFYNAYCLMTHMPTVLIQGGISKGDIIICDENNNSIIMGNAFLNAHRYTEKYPIGMYLDYKNIYPNETISKIADYNDVSKYFNYYMLSLQGFKNEELLYLNFVRNHNYSITELYQFLEALHTYYINANDEQKIRKFTLCFLMLSLTNAISLKVDESTFNYYKGTWYHE